jgi:hypothetical protein
VRRRRRQVSVFLHFRALPTMPLTLGLGILRHGVIAACVYVDIGVWSELRQRWGGLCTAAWGAFSACTLRWMPPATLTGRATRNDALDEYHAHGCVWGRVCR